MMGISLVDVAVSSAIHACPRKLIICMGAEDATNLVAQLGNDKDFTIRGADFELCFTRRKAYWPQKAQP